MNRPTIRVGREWRKLPETAAEAVAIYAKSWQGKTVCAGSEKWHRLPADGFGFFIGKDANATSSNTALTQVAKRRPYYFLNRCNVIRG